MAYSPKFWESDHAEPESQDWTFAAAPTRDLTHCYHDYPARMIPQVAGKLLDTFAPAAGFLFDPYCGSGTSLVEGVIRGINVIGTDLNPLARLISTAKTATPELNEVRKQIALLEAFTRSHEGLTIPVRICGINRLDFWFKPNAIQKLSILKSFIDELRNNEVRLFFQVAFSETVRESSNTRNEEFKLYRYDAERLEKFEPDVYGTMLSKLMRNSVGLQQFVARLRRIEKIPRARVCEFDTTLGVPHGVLPPASVDIVVTSPPYGDSHTTVAYGQYSRLSAAWLGLKSPEQVDRKLMGGRAIKSVPRFPCSELNSALERIESKDVNRAREVASFYQDLQSSIFNVAQLVKRGGHACYVVGNRKVRGTTLPTDDVIRSFFGQNGFTHINTFHRAIPNKRMPLRNSPTNAAGIVDSTMSAEHVIVMRRDG